MQTLSITIDFFGVTVAFAREVLVEIMAIFDTIIVFVLICEPNK